MFIKNFIAKPLSVSLLLLSALTSGCQSRTEQQIEGSIQGTTYHIKVVLDKQQSNIPDLKTQVESLFEEIDKKLSNWREDSEISLFNRDHSRNWVTLSPEIVRLIAISRDIHDKTGGCYDLTVKPIFDLWGFSKHQNRIPEASEIDQALTHVGMNKLELNPAQNQIRKLDPEVQVDLSSIAQGYTVDKIAELMDRLGIASYLVEIGGEMMVKGVKADGSPWRVAIEKPTPFTREVERVLDVHEERGTAIMTAGTYRNFFEEAGKSYSHIFNPKTGRPVTHNLLSVTLLDQSPTMADAWDTALLCLGETEGSKLAESENLKALFIYKNGDQLQEQMTSAFQKAEGAPAGEKGK